MTAAAPVAPVAAVGWCDALAREDFFPPLVSAPGVVARPCGTGPPRLFLFLSHCLLI
jgi:hypothetical protein